MSTLNLRLIKGSPLTNAEVDNNFTNILVAIGGANTAPYTVPTPTGTGVPALNTSPTFSTHIFGGTNANSTRFPLAFASISSVTSGAQNETTSNIGLIAEAGADASVSGQYGVGLYGVGYTSNINRSVGVQGEAHVSSATDNANAIGVRGYSSDSRNPASTGLNIGLYADASGSSVGNYALYMNTGNIYSAVAQTWTVQSGGLTISGGPLVLNTALAVTSGGTGVTTSTGSGSNVLSASPTFTGAPIAPTAASGTNTTQVATTQFSTSVANDTAVAMSIALG